MADQTRTTDGGLNRDRMGQRIQQSLSELDEMVAELLGSDELSGQFDRITLASTTYLDDWVDGHQDGDDSLFAAALDRNTAQPGGIDSAEAAVAPVEQVAQTSPTASASPTPPAASPPTPAPTPAPQPPPAPVESATEDAGGESASDVAGPGANEFYIRRGTQILGPVSDRKIRLNIDKEKIRSKDEIGASQDGPWEALGDIDSYSSLF